MVDANNDDELVAIIMKQGLDRETDSREELENRYSTTSSSHQHKEEEVVIAPEQHGPQQKDQQRSPVGDSEIMPHLLKIDNIIPWPNQPRRKFAASNDGHEDVDSLAESIKQDGLHQAILVRPVKEEDGTKKYQIVYGERRWHACKKLGYDLMPARIVVNDNMSDEEAFKIAVTENWHRTDYTPQQREHIAYELWTKTKSKNPGEEHSTREVAEILGISQSEVSRLINARRIRSELGTDSNGISVSSRALMETEQITNKSTRIQFLRKVERGEVRNLIEAARVLASAPDGVARAYLADEITIDDIREHNERAQIAELRDESKINELEMENQKLKRQRDQEQKLSLQQPSMSEIFKPLEEKKGEQQFEPDREHFRSFGRPEFQNDTPMLYNAKMFMRVDPRLGQLDYPGSTSGQIIMNLLYYYTKPDDLVVDPMAGGGTTMDTCNLMGRRCFAYDIHPVRSDITQHDISNGFPEKAELCDAIFLDPPYGNIMQEHYSKESISSASIPDFMNFMEKLARDSFSTVKPGGYVALVMMPIVDEKEGNEDNFTNLPFECTKVFRAAGFKEVNDWEIPLAPHVKNGAQVEKAKRKKLMLNLHRRVIIFKKNK